MNLTSFEECNCQGPGATCGICNPHQHAAWLQTNIHDPMYDLICKEKLEPIVLKVKWIECTTDGATLVRTKNEWFWIPISLIRKIKRRNKGWKFVVEPYFKKSPIKVKIHRYFERKEHEL